MIDKLHKDSCTGCKACGDICPKEAISFPIDAEGFWHPIIDEDKCIKCNLCEKACPALSTSMFENGSRKVPSTYKVYHKDKNVRYNSTSGALYYALAESFVENRDYIAGCVYDDDYKGAHHEVGNTVESLQKIMRSKYFQSDTAGVYKTIKKLLQKSERVLFCGTGCQVAGLYGFLGKDYPGLYTVELICRGVNSPLAFSSYMDELEKKFGSEIQEVHLKNKSHGWTNLGTLVKFKNGESYYKDRYHDPWVNAYIVGNLYIRPCCEHCKYKSFPRVADITIGDFWGLKFSKEEQKLGVSVALVNTPKGDELMSTSKNFMEVEERSLDEAAKGNPALQSTVKMNPDRNEFFKRIKNEPYSKVVWNLLGITKMSLVISTAKRNTKTLLKKCYYRLIKRRLVRQRMELK
ncbi:Coenzyme F420 hydrogenase/dehydrogenase, beta subunit C-terminal domain [Murimonas intestini]|uniref:Coenzyme F420-reducing hydrogenase beta subunit n=1 Tax=Murimonas intestini TaxID=1337051 RepID=A0AB73T533_9FIRM|nr:Coenzyme F420 hydrogenase/dehydrogenase, beta subunit C-terminal domain [Murimonas intestini]MCR1840685.1 Coenzyme F420 hydrogenase/dehydrogenase, beta subunit C-terminal domain [Murimonas intestini]MCR1865262.1 Coenzyme F420 hydrogenase/dehydrogenase, beta subunit C-terminal domain [Murimonas intestini]MCR1883026.1 Coenzyme F420 hydrogenase/dehydrogenase, beta subunit C-terminal domain [Murimonas intestini]